MTDHRKREESQRKQEKFAVAATNAVVAAQTVLALGGTECVAEQVVLSILLNQGCATDDYGMPEAVESKASRLLATPLPPSSLQGRKGNISPSTRTKAIAKRALNGEDKYNQLFSSLNSLDHLEVESLSGFFEEFSRQGVDQFTYNRGNHTAQLAKETSQVKTIFEANNIEGDEFMPNETSIEITEDDFSATALKLSVSRVFDLCIKRGHSSWMAKGYKETSPILDKTYFPFLAARCQELYEQCLDEEVRSTPNLPVRVGRKDFKQRLISVCIPCYNEDASSLKRSLESLRNQNLPPDVRMEILVAMDGVVQISESMATYLSELFGISFKVGHMNNPFERLQRPNTIVVESTVDNNIVLGTHLTLLVKRKNCRKVNSQEWWLRSHAVDSCCEFAFATDCGILFDKNCLLQMLRRSDREPNLSGLTGYQRVMSARMQGDDDFEFFSDPVGCFLRQIQCYDFEVSQSTTKSLLNSLGFIPVLPGPCSFFRFEHLQGVLDDYFSLTTATIKGDHGGIILGNVQLAEDRFPPVLLTFRFKGSCQRAGIARPKTGFVHDAVFYFEAEKPLRQLVTQRRRWINGSYTAAYWVLLDSWIGKADHLIIAKLGAYLILLIELLQGALIRLCVPATLACGLMYMCTIVPSVYANDSERVREILNGSTVEFSLVSISAVTAGLYLAVFALFVISHTPHAIRSTDEDGEVQWESDRDSAYRPRIFFLAFIVNAATIVLFIYVGVGVVMSVGWKGAPGYFQALCLLTMLPHLVTFMDGLVNSDRPNFRALWNLIILYPFFLISSTWFYVWLPCYATARISDLSWGNRNCTSQSLTMVLFSVLVLNVILHSGNLLDMLVRLFLKCIPRCLCGEPPPPLKNEGSRDGSALVSELGGHDEGGSIDSVGPTPIGPRRWRFSC
ncbi:transmembrane chitin synthase, glycosaminyl transferas [Phaeodactylum tricornutum CCAP 1055/1]|uniref:chitin synthase n=1 Tax=Phaeodactylum tricornutum (strain CCAP 1055/1) TaxID=556484 RepID=B7FVJ2_PHATC|nr:transmembrane chitin synthase, glycosaminyl transferas [Phaeodactylum tricornutum CCAP 1055/1]EEC49413.1 transmembrane chitin synthase, glycosaminyl transferas [Phaeodactylum tricornutum CCAP 1055/1]|eukprot:XP_002178715.1 transmembrane chitin synthase, glycosaminyl transferas [Phaeodactylum tricornutum CCAP 1055/1]